MAKKRWIIAGVLVMAIGGCTAAMDDSGSKTTTTKTEPVSTKKAQDDAKKDDLITKETYDKLHNGMTYEEVQQIVGGVGEITSEAGDKGSELYTMVVTYKGKGDIGANVVLTFQDNKLQAKAQFGLK